MNADYRAPIVTIGAGRSGSTMLAAVPNAHPEVSFFSETHFLVPTVWERVFKQHDLIMNCLVS